MAEFRTCGSPPDCRNQMVRVWLKSSPLRRRLNTGLRLLLSLLCHCAVNCKSVQVFPVSSAFIQLVAPEKNYSTPPPDADFRLSGIDVCEIPKCVDETCAEDYRYPGVFLEYRNLSKTISYDNRPAGCTKKKLRGVISTHRAFRESVFLSINHGATKSIKILEVVSETDLQLYLPGQWEKHPIVNALLQLGLFNIEKAYRDEKGVVYLFKDERSFIVYESLKEYTPGWGVSISEGFVKASKFSENELAEMLLPRANRINVPFSDLVKGRTLRAFRTQVHDAPMILVSRTHGEGIQDLIHYASPPGAELIFVEPDAAAFKGNSLVQNFRYPGLALVPATGVVDLISFPFRSIEFDSIVFVFACIFGGCFVPPG